MFPSGKPNPPNDHRRPSVSSNRLPSSKSTRGRSGCTRKCSRPCFAGNYHLPRRPTPQQSLQYRWLPCSSRSNPRKSSPSIPSLPGSTHPPASASWLGRSYLDWLFSPFQLSSGHAGGYFCCRIWVYSDFKTTRHGPSPPKGFS